MPGDKEELALFGGPKAIRRPFVRYNSIGAEEALAAKQVIESGGLSQSWAPGTRISTVGPKSSSSNGYAKRTLA